MTSASQGFSGINTSNMKECINQNIGGRSVLYSDEARFYRPIMG